MIASTSGRRAVLKIGLPPWHRLARVSGKSGIADELRYA